LQWQRFSGFEAVEIGEKQKPQGAFAFFGTEAVGGLSSAEDEAKEKVSVE